jgi:hypothetical protein
MVGHLPFLAHDASKVLACVGRHAFLLDIWTGNHDRTKLLLLAGVETARPARLRPIVEAVEPFGIVALDGVAQRLSRHTGKPRRLAAGQAVQHIGDRQHAQPRAPVRLRPCKAPQLVRRKRSANPQTASSHGTPRIKLSVDAMPHNPRNPQITIESFHLLDGMKPFTEAEQGII